MITSTLARLHWYKSIGPRFETAIRYILATDFGRLEPGRYAVDGENVFAIVNEYLTKPPSECDPEAHRDYADIQVMVSGAERFGYSPLTDQVPAVPYDPERDVAFYTPDESAPSHITLRAGEFIIFFPTDIHQPELFVRQPELVKKVVVKVAV